MSSMLLNQSNTPEAKATGLKLYHKHSKESKENKNSTTDLKTKQHKITQNKTKGLYSKGFDVMKWLQYSDTVPPTDYLLSTPISMPLIGFTQLLNYWIMLKLLNKNPHELRSLIKGTTGHSQGSLFPLSSFNPLEFWLSIFRSVSLTLLL